MTAFQARSSGGSCPWQTRLLNISSEPPLSHSPHTEANTPLSPAGSWPPAVLICDFIFPKWGWGSCSELGSYPTSPARSLSSWASAPLPRPLSGSAFPLSICAARLLRGACRTGAGQAGHPASRQSLHRSRLGIQTASISLPVHIKETKHLERFTNIQEKEQRLHSESELCPASTFTSNKSALKMYKGITKKNRANYSGGNPFLPCSAISLHQLFALPRRAASHVRQQCEQNSSQAQTHVSCRAQTAVGLAGRLANVASRVHWASGFVLTLANVFRLEKSQRCLPPC